MPASRATRRSGTAALSRTDRSVGPSYSLAGDHGPDRGAGTGPAGPPCALTCLLPATTLPRCPDPVRVVGPPECGVPQPPPHRPEPPGHGGDRWTLARPLSRRIALRMAEPPGTMPAVRGGPSAAPTSRVLCRLRP